MDNNSFVARVWALRQEIPVLKKDTSGFKFKYTDLRDILETVDPLLVREKIGYYHQTRVDSGWNLMRTVLFNTENPDEFLDTELVIPANVELAGMNGYQSLGSAITYFRRYSLVILLGIVTDDDVDAQNKPTESKAEIGYVEKFENLIKMGRKLPSLEKYFMEYSSKMNPDERSIIVQLIRTLKDEAK